jgi:hypothetical protein
MAPSSDQSQSLSPWMSTVEIEVYTICSVFEGELPFLLKYMCGLELL